ncbi:MAG: lipopolysaccharide heptosyltransferase II [Acidihalobacter sp.]|jgi:heptosyltransferase-2
MPEPNSDSSCLIVGPSWVGDMVLAQSLFITLARRQPGLAIDVLAPRWSEPLLARMPEVRKSIIQPLGHGQLKLGVRRELGRLLRGERYGQVIVLPNSFKSALIPYFARIPRRTGYRGELRYGLLNDRRLLNKTALPQTVQRFVALGLPADSALPPDCPRPSLQVDESARDAALQRLELDVDRPVLALCPGAEYGPAKRWPAGHFAAVARDRLAAGWCVWVFGSGKDADIAAQVCAQAGEGCVNLAGQTSLGEAIDLLSLAAAVVSNDSGLMHVAAALGRPLVAVYGSSDPGFTPPMSERARIERLGLNCSPCFERECPLGHTNCLNQLAPERVLASLHVLTV